MIYLRIKTEILWILHCLGGKFVQEKELFLSVK